MRRGALARRMPRLLLLRHAKAEPARAGQPDHERALEKRGRKDAARMGLDLAGRDEAPDRILCSSSQRTRETWGQARSAFSAAPEPAYMRELFEAESDYIEIIRGHGGDAASLMVVGHNPAIHATAVRLAENVASGDGAAMQRDFPTSAVAILEFSGAWSDLQSGSMRLAAFLRPERS